MWRVIATVLFFYEIYPFSLLSPLVFDLVLSLDSTQAR